GGLDLMFNRNDEQNSILIPLTYDFSLPGKALTVSMMVKIKAPIVNNRAIQMGFITSSNVGNAVSTMVTPSGVAYMSVLLQSSTNNASGPPTTGYQLRTIGKPTAGTTATPELAPINNPTNLLTTNNWYKL